MITKLGVIRAKAGSLLTVGREKENGTLNRGQFGKKGKTAQTFRPDCNLH